MNTLSARSAQHAGHFGDITTAGQDRGSPSRVAECYDAAATAYDSWKWQDVWHATEWPRLQCFIGSPRSILEIGIGTGAIAERILRKVDPRTTYVGVDISSGMLEVCRRKLPQVKLIHADATNFIFTGPKFDFIFMCRVLSHVRNPGSVFANVSNMLTHDGRVVVSELSAEHNYEVTRLPLGSGTKIDVETYKHSNLAITDAAFNAGLRLRHEVRIYADDVKIPGDTEVPDSIAKTTRPLSTLFVFAPIPRDEDTPL